MHLEKMQEKIWRSLKNSTIGLYLELWGLYSKFEQFLRVFYINYFLRQNIHFREPWKMARIYYVISEDEFSFFLFHKEMFSLF